MRRLSDLVHHLCRRLWLIRESELREASDERVKIIAELGRHAGPVFIPTVVELIAHPDPRTAAAAVDAISHRIQQTPVSGLRKLEDAMRGGWFDDDDGMYWYRKHPISAKHVHRGDLPIPVLGVLSFHRNGYVREAALRQLTLARDGSELPFVVLRWNDWVAPIRDLARIAIAERLTAGYAEHWFAAMPLVRAVSMGQRNSEQQWLVDHATALCRSLAARPALWRALDSSDQSVRRDASVLSWGIKDADRIPMFQQALRDADSVIRLRAARLATAMLDGEDLDAALGALSRDPLMGVRREALYAVLKHRPERAAAMLKSALLDPHASMRHAARVYLRDIEPLDPPRWYRDRFLDRDGAHLAVAIRGYGETADPDGTRDIVPLLGHADSRVRAAATEALGKLDGEHQLEALLRSLTDPHPAVSRAAREALVRLRHRLTVADLHPAFDPAQPPHVRRNTTRVLRGLALRDHLPLLIRLAADPDAGVARLAGAGLQRPSRLFRPTWLPPDPGLVAAANTALNEVRDRLPADVRATVTRLVAKFSL